MTISLPDETAASLRGLSERTEINVSALCNLAIKELLRHPTEVIGAAVKAQPTMTDEEIALWVKEQEGLRGQQTPAKPADPRGGPRDER